MPEIQYKAKIEIQGDQSQLSYLESIPELLQKNASAPISTNALRYKAESDVKLLKDGLENHGYYAGKVHFTLDTSNKIKNVKFIVEPGKVYRIEEVEFDITGTDELALMTAKAHKTVAIHVGQRVRLDKALGGVSALKNYFVSHGYPDAVVDEPIGQLNDSKGTLRLIYRIHLHGKKQYGSLVITGNKAVSECYIRNRFHILSKEYYDQRQLDKSRRALLDSELFSSVLISHKTVGDKADIKVDLREAPFRRVGAGIRYGTQEGIGGKLLWQHKNAFGNGEDFFIRGEGGQRQFKASIGIKIPDVIWQDFNLSNIISLTRAETKAYDGNIYNYYIGLEHQIDNKSTYGFGFEAEHSNLNKTSHMKRTFAGIPLYYKYDASNDRINPYKGWRARVDFAPYMGDFARQRPMIIASAHSSQYWRLIRKDKLVIATWEKVGQIGGVPFEDIPLNRRWYGGGSGSVRGYGYQKLSKPDSQGNPVGGKSIIEVGVEPRWHMTEKFGLAVFFESGVVSEHQIPGLKSQEFLSGYGLGGRYYTDIGPIRVDLAFPTKRRKVLGKSYDSPVQFYISLGQAF